MTRADTPDAPTVAGVAAPPSAWGWVLASGLVMILAGVLALAAPTMTSLVVAIALGWILAISGVAGIVMGFRARSRHRRSLDLVYGIASLVIGVIVLAEPATATLALTLAIAFWLAFRGVAELVGAARVGASRLRWLLVLAGLVNLLLAIALIASFPYPAMQVIGLFVAISLLVAGITTIVAAVQLRQLA